MQFSSIQFSSVQFSSVQFNPDHFSTVQLNSVQFSSVQISSVQFSLFQFSSVKSRSVQFNWIQFSSVQFKMVFCTHKSPYTFHAISKKLTQHCLWNSSNVHLIDNGPLSSFQGRLLSTFSVHTSLKHYTNPTKNTSVSVIWREYFDWDLHPGSPLLMTLSSNIRINCEYLKSWRREYTCTIYIYIKWRPNQWSTKAKWLEQ